MPLPVRRRYHSTRFSLTSSQHQTLTAVARSLPEPQRHSFMLRVSGTLQLSGQHIASDALVQKSIDRALRELPHLKEAG
jgi:hypothetical protein